MHCISAALPSFFHRSRCIPRRRRRLRIEKLAKQLEMNLASRRLIIEPFTSNGG